MYVHILLYIYIDRIITLYFKVFIRYNFRNMAVKCIIYVSCYEFLPKMKMFFLYFIFLIHLWKTFFFFQKKLVNVTSILRVFSWLFLIQKNYCCLPKFINVFAQYRTRPSVRTVRDQAYYARFLITAAYWKKVTLFCNAIYRFLRNGLPQFIINSWPFVIPICNNDWCVL